MSFDVCKAMSFDEFIMVVLPWGSCSKLGVMEHFSGRDLVGLVEFMEKHLCVPPAMFVSLGQGKEKLGPGAYGMACVAFS
jgi:hypothetical protein